MIFDKTDGGELLSELVEDDQGVHHLLLLGILEYALKGSAIVPQKFFPEKKYI